MGFTFLDAKGDSREGTILNVGPGGLAVRVENPPPPGAHVSFVLTLSGTKTVRGEGLIVWSAAQEGRTGLCFMNLDEYARQMVNLWLTQRGVTRRLGD